MNAIRNLFAAFSTLAASVNGLAGVIDQASNRLRQNLALDGEPVPALPGGEVIDGNAQGSAEPAPQRNGRRKATA